MALYGTTSASSLLSSARAAASSYQALEDKQYADEWNQGYQDQAALDKYQSYLNNRIKTLSTSANPADQLRAMNYADTLRTAQKTFNTNQIQNISLGILNGDASESDKLGALKDQLVSAIQKGADPQTIQGLETLYSNQVLKVQNEATANANAAAEGNARAAAALYKQSVSTPLKDINAQIAKGQDLFKNNQIDANTYSSQMSALFQQKDKILSHAYNTPGLEDYADTIQTQQSDLHKEANYDKLADPTNLLLLHNNVDLFHNTVDDHGNQSLDYNPAIGFKIEHVKQPDGSVQQVRVPQIAINAGGKEGAARKTLGVPDTVTIHTANGDINTSVKVDNLDKPNYAYATYKDSKGNWHAYQITADGQHILMDTGKNEFDPTKAQVPVQNAYKNNQPDFEQSFDKALNGVPVLDHNPVIEDTAKGVSYLAKSSAHDLMHPMSVAKDVARAQFGQGALGAILNPVGSAINQTFKAVNGVVHPSQIGQQFLAAVTSAAHQISNPSPRLNIPALPVNNAPYTKSVLYTPPTPYPNAQPNSPQHNTNTVNSINNAIGGLNNL